MTRWVLALAVILVAPAAEAQTRWEQCLTTTTCKAEVDRAIAAAVDAYKATLPCRVFVYSDEGQELVGLTEPACVVINAVKPCGADFCGTMPGRP